MALSSGAIAQLGAQHPLLVLERAHDVDQHVLRDRVALSDSVHALARGLADLRDPVGDDPYHAVALGRLGRHRRQRRSGRDGPSLSLRYVPEGDRALRSVMPHPLAWLPAASAATGDSGDPAVTARACPSGTYPRATARSATTSARSRQDATSSSSCSCTGRKACPTTAQCSCLPISDRSTS